MRGSIKFYASRSLCLAASLSLKHNKAMEASARPQRLSIAMAGAATHFSPAASLAFRKTERFRKHILTFNLYDDRYCFYNYFSRVGLCP